MVLHLFRVPINANMYVYKYIHIYATGSKTARVGARVCV